MKLLLIAAALAGTAQPPRACLTPAEAEAVTVVAIPEIIRQTGVTCAAVLPASSLLRQTESTLLQRYDAAADRAWPSARAAIVKLSDPEAEALLGSQFARPLLTAMVTPMIVARIATKDCGTLDRLVTLLEPLPPRNAAGVVVAALGYFRGRSTGGNDPIAALPLCRTGAK